MVRGVLTWVDDTSFYYMIEHNAVANKMINDRGWDLIIFRLAVGEIYLADKMTNWLIRISPEYCKLNFLKKGLYNGGEGWSSLKVGIKVNITVILLLTLVVIRPTLVKRRLFIILCGWYTLPNIGYHLARSGRNRHEEATQPRESRGLTAKSIYN